MSLLSEGHQERGFAQSYFFILVISWSAAEPLENCTRCTSRICNLFREEDCAMKSLLANCTNKLVQVAIPTLFRDSAPRVCKFLGFEDVGVWLESEELTKAVYGNEDVGIAAVFVPLVHLVFLVPGAGPPTRRERLASSALTKTGSDPKATRERNPRIHASAKRERSDEHHAKRKPRR